MTTLLEIIAEILKEEGINAGTRTYLHNSIILNETHQLTHNPRTGAIILLNLRLFAKHKDHPAVPPTHLTYDLSDPEVSPK